MERVNTMHIVANLNLVMTARITGLELAQFLLSP